MYEGPHYYCCYLTPPLPGDGWGGGGGGPEPEGKEQKNARASDGKCRKHQLEKVGETAVRTETNMATKKNGTDPKTTGTLRKRYAHHVRTCNLHM